MAETQTIQEFARELDALYATRNHPQSAAQITSLYNEQLEAFQSGSRSALLDHPAITINARDEILNPNTIEQKLHATAMLAYLNQMPETEAFNPVFPGYTGVDMHDFLGLQIRFHDPGYDPEFYETHGRPEVYTFDETYEYFFNKAIEHAMRGPIDIRDQKLGDVGDSLDAVLDVYEKNLNLNEDQIAGITADAARLENRAFGNFIENNIAQKARRNVVNPYELQVAFNALSQRFEEEVNYNQNSPMGVLGAENRDIPITELAEQTGLSTFEIKNAVQYTASTLSILGAVADIKAGFDQQLKVVTGTWLLLNKGTLENLASEFSEDATLSAFENFVKDPENRQIIVELLDSMPRMSAARAELVINNAESMIETHYELALVQNPENLISQLQKYVETLGGFKAENYVPPEEPDIPAESNEPAQDNPAAEPQAQPAVTQ